MPPPFYSERSGWLRDPSGHRWNVGYFLDEVTPEEMHRLRPAALWGGRWGSDDGGGAGMAGGGVGLLRGVVSGSGALLVH